MSFVCQRGVQLGGDPGSEMQQEFVEDDTTQKLQS